MLKNFSLLKVAIPFSLLSASCHMERAQQENFQVTLEGHKIQDFYLDLKDDFNGYAVSAPRYDKRASSSSIFRLDLDNAMIIIQPMSDTRCQAVQKGSLTYEKKLYYLDLVFENRLNSEERRKLIDKLNSIAKKTGVNLEKLEDC